MVELVAAVGVVVESDMVGMEERIDTGGVSSNEKVAVGLEEDLR